MASLHKVKGRNGTFTWRISYYDRLEVRRYLRLGAMGKREATGIAARVESLVRTVNAGLPLDSELSAWSAKIGTDLANRLTEHGLLPERQIAKLEEFTEAYITGRGNISPRTVLNFRQTQKSLVDYFGKERLIHAIKPGEAHEWHEATLKDGYASATVSKRIKQAKQMFEHAIAKRFILANPFKDLKPAGERNDERLFFVERSTIDMVMRIIACPQWRVILALSRFGGLRTPSETLIVKWSDVLWDEGIIVVPSPKTKRHNKAFRRVPLFPELREYLNAAWDAAPEGATHIVEKYKDATNANLRTQFLRFLQRAGITPWERLFHNMRATRQIELCDEFPDHVVSDWMGNSPLVAKAHYLKTTQTHLEKAIRPKAIELAVTEESQSPVGVPQGVPQDSKTVAHRASPQARESKRTATKNAGKDGRNFTLVPSGASRCDAPKYPHRDLNLKPSASEADALSN